jgi:hypothetical protein
MPQACKRGAKPRRPTLQLHGNQNWRIARPLHEESGNEVVVSCSSASWPHAIRACVITICASYRAKQCILAKTRW